MPTYLLGALFYFVPEGVGADYFPPAALWTLLLLIWIYTFLIPVMAVYGMVRLNLVGDLMLERLSDRKLPFWVTVMVYSAALYFFGWRFNQVSEISTVLRVVLGCITLSIASVAVISSFWQISAHATGVGGVSGALVGALIRLEDPALITPFLIAILISGWVTASRLHLNAHTMSEIGAGYALGGIICAGGVILFL